MSHRVNFSPTLVKCILRILPLVFLSLCSQAQTQTEKLVDVDTISVNGCKFVIETPLDWYSVKVQDGIVDDTSWNYYAKTYEQTQFSASFIGIQFNERELEDSTSLEDKKQRKKYTVYDDKRSGWPCYIINKKSEKVKDCKTCGEKYLTVCIFPINDRLELNFVLEGYGSFESTNAARNQFNKMCESFVVNNFTALKLLMLWNDTIPPAPGSLNIGNASVRTLLPGNSSSSSEMKNSVYAQKTSILNKPIRVIVTYNLVDKNEKDRLTVKPQFRYNDTDLTLKFPQEEALLSGKESKGLPLYELQKKKYVLQSDSSMLIIEVMLQFDNPIDKVTLEYYKLFCKYYSESVASANQQITRNILFNNNSSPNLLRKSKNESEKNNSIPNPIIKPK